MIKIHTIFALGYKNSVRILVQNGSDVNKKNCDGFTPLHLAAVLGHAGIVKIFVENNGDVNAQTNAGQTPFYLATQIGNFNKWHFPFKIRTLLNYGFHFVGHEEIAVSLKSPTDS